MRNKYICMILNLCYPQIESDVSLRGMEGSEVISHGALRSATDEDSLSSESMDSLTHGEWQWSFCFMGVSLSIISTEDQCRSNHISSSNILWVFNC